MSRLTGKARTAETYLAGLGASGALIAGAIVAFLLLAGAVTFDVWPRAAGLFGSGDAGVDQVDADVPAGTAAAALGSAADEVAGPAPGRPLVDRSAAVAAARRRYRIRSVGRRWRDRRRAGDRHGHGVRRRCRQAAARRVGDTVGDTVNQVGNTVNNTVNGAGNTVNNTVNGAGDAVDNTVNGAGNTVNGLLGGGN